MIPNNALDDKILDYHDVLLRRSDVDLFSRSDQISQWLNDQCIAFYLEYLSHEKFADISEHVLLVPGATTYLLMTAGRDIAPAILEPLNFHHKSYTLFIVNNNPDITTGNGGSHWSLAVYCKSTNTLRHYDSSANMNDRAAHSLFKALETVLPGGDTLCRYEAPTSFSPQQENGYDCGMMVLVNVEEICFRVRNKFKQNNDIVDIDWNLNDAQRKSEVSEAALARRRQEIYELICNKAHLTM